MTADLATVLAMDFRAADLGDTPENFDTRLQYLVAQAQARANATPAQQEAGVRYLLLAAQIRQLNRNPESLHAPSGASITQGLAARLAELRRQMGEQLALSGLDPTDGRGRSFRSVSVPVGTVP